MPAIAMEGDVDAFLREVRSSEQLLQELQERLRAVQAETERQRAAVAALSSERRGLAEEQLSGEQELAAAASARELQEVRLTRVQEFRAGVRRELAEVATERTGVRARLQEEVGALCTEAAQHLNRFGLRGSYREQHKQKKLDELSKLKAQTDTLSREITSLRHQESILQQELEKLSATEREVEAQRVSLRQPLEGRARVQQLQQTLSHLVQEQRDGRHVQQLTADISDAEDETTCLRSAAGAMTSELQRLEQLLWFTNMERMKQRMRAQARNCPGQYHCATAGAFREQAATGDRGPTFTGTAPPPASARHEGPPAPVMEEPAGQHGADTEDADANADDAEEADVDDGPEEPPPDEASRGRPSDWPGQHTDRQPNAPATGGRDPGHGSSAGLGSSASDGGGVSGGGGGGPSAAELAQRRWGARRALMMARRQPPTSAAPAAPASHHSTAPRPPPVDPAPPPPLASVRPQQRLVNAPAAASAPTTNPAATASPGRRARGWGRAAAPGRLSYRGPQPAKRTGMDFRTGLQKLREQMAEELGVGTAGSAQKRVRFAADPPPEEDPVDWDDEDFL